MVRSMTDSMRKATMRRAETERQPVVYLALLMLLILALQVYTTEKGGTQRSACTLAAASSTAVYAIRCVWHVERTWIVHKGEV